MHCSTLLRKRSHKKEKATKEGNYRFLLPFFLKLLFLLKELRSRLVNNRTGSILMTCCFLNYFYFKERKNGL